MPEQYLSAGPAQRSIHLADGTFDGVKVFAATMFADRAALGDVITTWIAAHPELTLTEITVVQSSDAAFHCLSFVIFYRGAAAARGRG